MIIPRREPIGSKKQIGYATKWEVVAFQEVALWFWQALAEVGHFAAQTFILAFHVLKPRFS